MSELYLKASEIRQQAKFTVSRFHLETGLSESTIKRILRDPFYKSNDSAIKLVDELYKAYIKNPFPKRLEAIDIMQKIMIKRLPPLEYKEYGDPILQQRLELDLEYGARNLADARIHWLLGHLCFERAKYLSLRMHDNYLSAVTYYRRAYEILSAQKNLNLGKYLCQIKMTSIAASFNILKHEERHSAKTRKMLDEIGFINDAENLLIQQPWQYTVARNALVVSSLLHDFNKANMFADHLIKLVPKFFEPGFQWSPEDKSATEDPDLKWFMDKRYHTIQNHSFKRE